MSPSSYTSSSNSHGRQVSLSTSATSQSSYLSSLSQDTIVTASEATSNHCLAPFLSDEEQIRRSSSSRREAANYSRQRSNLSLKRNITAPALPTLRDGEALAPSTLPALPQLTTDVYGEGMFAASHASAPPVSSHLSGRKGVTSCFIEHLDIALAAPEVDLDLHPLPSTFASLGLETYAVPPPLPMPKHKYGSLPLLRTKSRDLLSSASSSSKSSRKMSATSLFNIAPSASSAASRKSSDSFVLLPAPSPSASASADYPYFGANGSKVKEGRPVLYKRGMSLPLLMSGRSRSSTFLPVMGEDELENEELCPTLSIGEQHRNIMPFASSLIPRPGLL